MSYDPHRHHRRSIRVKGYDYAQEGLYFVTTCVQGGLCLLGEIEEGVMRLSEAGEMVTAVWYDLPVKYPSASLDAFICMPNHVHFIVGLTDPSVEAEPGARPEVGDDLPSLPDTVQWYKSMTTARYRHGVYNNNWRPFDGRFWQRNYYEQIIRNERHLNAIRRYIQDNPATWIDDELHPTAPQKR